MRKSKVSKTKDLTKPKKKEKIIRLPISKFIDSKFRDYAVYNYLHATFDNYPLQFLYYNMDKF